jgi:hypothetical protein
MFFTSVDLQHFRIRTRLIFHDPVAKRAFGGELRSPTAPAAPPFRLRRNAKRAARSVSAPLYLSRYCYKSRTSVLSLASFITEHYKPNLQNLRQQSLRKNHAG